MRLNVCPQWNVTSVSKIGVQAALFDGYSFAITTRRKWLLSLLISRTNRQRFGKKGSSLGAMVLNISLHLRRSLAAYSTPSLGVEDSLLG